MMSNEGVAHHSSFITHPTLLTIHDSSLIPTTLAYPAFEPLTKIYYKNFYCKPMFYEGAIKNHSPLFWKSPSLHLIFATPKTRITLIGEQFEGWFNCYFLNQLSASRKAKS
jgi:hypothetical protein